MKVTRLLIGTTTLCILFSGITVATENPHEQITIEGVRPAVFDHDTHLGYGVKCGECHHKSQGEPYTDQEVISRSSGKTLYCIHCHDEKFETGSLGELLKISRIREYEDGEVIIQEGDVDPWLYFLLSGKIRVSKEDMEINTIDKKGEIFGEMRVIDFMKRSASVVAVGKTVCLAVDTSAKNRISAQDPTDEKLDFLLLLYRIFAEYMSIRLRVTNEELITAKKKIKRLLTKI